jgi:hypothetical protein
VALSIEREGVEDFLRSLNGKMFSVVFTKRTTGETRKMLASTNFASKLKGGDPAYDAKSKGLLVVLDVVASKATPERAIRSIPLDAVSEIHAKGEVYLVK